MKFNEEITIIIVAYDSSDLIFKCLENLDNFKVIIVDNGNNENILNKLHSKNNLKIITKNKNLGFGNGINFAFQFVKSKYFLVLNPDIIISEESILKLHQTIIRYDNCAISAPLTLTDVDSYGILPEKRNIFEKNKNKISRISEKNSDFPKDEICVDVTKGCALMINSKYFKEVDMFSKEYFLFWEEIDLCRKFLNKKLSIIVNPLAEAYHNQGKSSKANFVNQFMRFYHNELSPLYYFDVKKNSFHIYKNIFKYLFRSFSYLLILNFRNSLKNFAKLLANFFYVLKK